MSAGKAKRMLVHTKENGEWNTKEFFSIADTKRYLRKKGVRFRDETAFYSPEYGTIIDNDKLIEIEEAFEEDECFEFFGKSYIPLVCWCRKNDVDYKTGVSLSASRKINTVRIGRKGRIFVEEKPVNIPYKNKPLSVNGAKYIPLAYWASLNGMDYNKAHYLCRKGEIDCIVIPKEKLKKIYVNERCGYGKE